MAIPAPLAGRTRPVHPPWYAPAARRTAPHAAAPVSSGPAFLVFVAATGLLLVRPAEVFPSIQGIELYFYAMAACVLLAAGDLLKYLTGAPLVTRPIPLCMTGLLVAAVLPNFVVFNLTDAWRVGLFFFKNLVYFLLLVSLVNAPVRLRSYVRWLLVFAAVALAVAVLDYHQFIKLPTLKALQDSEQNAWGEVTFFERLKFTGLFNDPNEVCVWLAALLPLALYNLQQDRDVFRRIGWLALIALYAYGIYLTRSRGGFLAMVAGLAVLVAARYGWRRAVAFAAVGLPILVLLFAGRQTRIETAAGTGQTRVQLWSDWLDRFRSSPVFGVGVELRDTTGDDKAAPAVPTEHVAHNSFLQAFADVGFPGGCLFLGAYYVALWSVWRVGRHRALRPDPAGQGMQPPVLAMVTAYGTGMLSLSLWTVAPTYMVLGLAAAYPVACRCQPPVPPVRLDGNLLARFAIAGVVYLVLMQLFVRVFVNWG